MSLPPGEVFAGFTIERELGAGGMGVVYLARHPRLPRRVALKLLRTDLGADPSFVGRFRREAETVARLDHPNIVAIDDSGAHDGQLWISMRFIDGTTAAGALTGYQGGGMPPERAVHIVEKVAAALDFAHRHHVVHRDVKPANILLTEDPDGDQERVYLTDFGVAKAMGEIEAHETALTAAGGVVATLDYAAPEQIEGKQLDGRCDVYALGCVLYKLLTGAIPYPGETLGAKVYARMHRPPPAPTALVPRLPAAFDEVVAKALALDPDDRYQTCRALAVDALAALGTHSGGATLTQRMDSAAAEATANAEATAKADADATRKVSSPGAPAPVPSAPAKTLLAAAGFASPGAPVPHSDSGPGRGQTSPASLPTDLADLLEPGRRPGAHGPADAPGRRSSIRRRSFLAVGAVTLVAVIVGGIVLLQRPRIAGNASVGPVATGSSTGVTTTPSTPATSPTASTVSSPTTPSSLASATSTPLYSTAVPVPGLPHSAPIDINTMVASRQDGKKYSLYAFSTVTPRVGTALVPAADYPQNPLISPERGTIVYVQGDASGGTVRTAAIDGQGDRLLFARPAGCLSIARPAWNPVDTKELAISCMTASGARSLQLVDLTGKVLSTLPTPGVHIGDDLAFSPDGKQLAFWGSTDPKAVDGRLYIERTDGNGLPHPITPAGSRDADPDFSPDGKHIAVRRVIGGFAQIVVIDADGADQQILTSGKANSQGPVWSPGGRQIAYKNDTATAGGTARYQIWVLAVATPTKAHQLLPGDLGTIAGSPAWGNR